ncbi:MAG TPA: hypothetical protein VIJ07_21290, partial [Dermatophilaceae bacterium]
MLQTRPNMLCSQLIAHQVAHGDYAEHTPHVIDHRQCVHTVIPDRADELTEGRFGTGHPDVSGHHVAHQVAPGTPDSLRRSLRVRCSPGSLSHDALFSVVPRHWPRTTKARSIPGPANAS